MEQYFALLDTNCDFKKYHKFQYFILTYLNAFIFTYILYLILIYLKAFAFTNYGYPPTINRFSIALPNQFFIICICEPWDIYI